jgi:UDPglucose 6-dehydrogenase
MAKICIVGDWHQAVVVGACLATRGHDVCGVAGSRAAAERLNAGEPPVHEPGLSALLREGIDGGTLRYAAAYGEALDGAEYVYIAIDTPVSDADAPELDTLFAAARAIGGELRGDIVLVVTAQVPVGTSEALRDVVVEGSGRDIPVAYVPEFLRLGHAIRTFEQADRFIVGCDDEITAARVAAIYEPLGRPVVRMGLRSAEMTKHACNAFLALSISFANEIADLCSAVGADVDAVTAGMKLDRRIGPDAFLSAGLGFAGGTLGRDLCALQRLAGEHGAATRLVDAALAVNRERGSIVRRRLHEIYGALAGLTVAVLGLTYKPGTSTIRRSIALEIIGELVAEGVFVQAYDPLAVVDGDAPQFARMGSARAAATGADALVLVTEWDGLDTLDFVTVRTAMRRPVLLDMRNRLDPGAMERAGFEYVGVGRAKRVPARAAAPLEAVR